MNHLYAYVKILVFMFLCWVRLISFFSPYLHGIIENSLYFIQILELCSQEWKLEWIRKSLGCLVYLGNKESYIFWQKLKSCLNALKVFGRNTKFSIVISSFVKGRLACVSFESFPALSGSHNKIQDVSHSVTRALKSSAGWNSSDPK